MFLSLVSHIILPSLSEQEQTEAVVAVFLYRPCSRAQRQTCEAHSTAPTHNVTSRVFVRAFFLSKGCRARAGGSGKVTPDELCADAKLDCFVQTCPTASEAEGLKRKCFSWLPAFFLWCREKRKLDWHTSAEDFFKIGPLLFTHLILNSASIFKFVNNINDNYDAYGKWDVDKGRIETEFIRGTCWTFWSWSHRSLAEMVWTGADEGEWWCQ